MQLLTIVEAYVNAAMKQARVEEQEDGTVAAYVPNCGGVLAFGEDVHDCATDLYRRLSDWVRVSLERGNLLPIIGGINLNSEAGLILATYRHGPTSDSKGDFLWDEQELEEAFQRHGEHGSHPS